MENGNGDTHVGAHVDAEVEQEQGPDVSAHQEDGSDESQTKPLTPRTLFGGSAALLKEADLNSLKANALEEIEEANAANEEQQPTQMEVDTTQEFSTEEVPSQEKEESTEQKEPIEEESNPEGEAVNEEEESGSPRASRSKRLPVKTPPSSRKRGRAKKEPVQDEENVEEKDAASESPRHSSADLKNEDENGTDQPAEEPETIDKPNSRTPRNRQSSSRAPITTPTGPSTRTTRSAKKAEPIKEEEPETPASKRTRRSVATTKKSEEEDETDPDEPEEEPTKNKANLRTPRGRKPSARAPAASSSSRNRGKPVDEEEEAEEPKTPQSSKRPQRRANSSKKPEQEETTPRAGPSNSGSAKKSATSRGRKAKQENDVVIDLDDNDPFNFNTKSHVLPGSLVSNIKVFKSNFGEMKFTRSPLSKDVEKRYANTEKAAAKNVSPIVPKQLTPSARPVSIMELSTTPDAQAALNKSGRGRKRARKSSTSDIFEPPQTSRSGRRGATPSKTVPTKPKFEEPSAEAQVEADFSEEPHGKGTRLYALWGSDFYPAYVIEERDGLGRYKVLYTEDGATRDIPHTGIITLSKLQVGSEIAVTKKDEGIMQPVKITRIPSKDDPNEWKEGVYDAEEVSEEGEGNQTVASYSWKDFFITKHQQKEIVGNILNQSIIVDTSNAVPRSARRSRLAASANIAEIIHPHTRHSSGSGKKSQEKLDEEDEDEAPVKRTPKKRARKADTSNTEEADAATPAKKRHLQSPEAVKEDNQLEDEQKMEVDEDNKLFKNCHFILTSSATKKSSAAQFNKRVYKEMVEKFGGIIVEDTAELEEMKEGDRAFLIADNYYRTQKYLFALASSLPCLHYTWLDACVENNKLVDYEPYLLKAGCSVIDNEEYPWTPLKGKLFKGKDIFCYAANMEPAQSLVQFSEIWRPLLTLLGANVITCDKTYIDDIVEFCKDTNFDYLLTDRSCDDKILTCVEEKDNVSAVSSNWVINAIVTNELASVDEHPSFSPRE